MTANNEADRAARFDTPLFRATLADMPDDEIDALIVEMRQRRMKAHEQYVAAQAAKRERANAATLRRLNHTLDMFQKELKAADKAIEKLEKRAMALRVCRLELGDESAFQDIQEQADES